ncbi:hypothetical protein EZ313_00350 [Ramlibacter henchirensis]|uniref:Glycosyltransferase RgtA/B/C/D-like domain-containing protein n=1 Tax=Ramlibacter henchirensis TaxID=204072 RepID=A0A4Z0C4Y1_9BURK|nr:hypothetical protein [Ramlibacter henchirensis]TFZ05169.1 hypothetical protein EZ313_00350 [Ramlibacter henchirensis]
MQMAPKNPFKKFSLFDADAPRAVNWLILLALAIAFYLAYSGHAAAPGADRPHPEGWFGWADQGEYLKAAKAFARMEFGPQVYLPGYSLTAVPFVWAGLEDPFALVNVACFLLFFWFFLEFGKSYVGWLPSLLVVGASLFWVPELMQLWVEPWTTSLVAPLYAWLFLQWERSRKDGGPAGRGRVVAMGLVGGAVLCTRPPEAVILVPYFVAFLALQLVTGSRTGNLPAAVRNCVLLVIAGLLGVAFFLGSNLVMHGNVLGYYVQQPTTSNGFNAMDLAEKLVSLFLDAGALYLSGEDAILRRLPWLALGVPAFFYVLWYGPSTLRILVVTILLQLAIYACFVDLLPTGVWMYHNIHYFKWMIPFIGLIALAALFDVVRSSTPRRRRVAYLGFCAVAWALLSARIVLIDETRVWKASFTSSQRQGVHLIAPGTGGWLDLVYLESLHGSFHQSYFGFKNRVVVDGVELRYLFDFRFLPAPSGVRLMFVRPVFAKEVLIEPKELAFAAEPLRIRVFHYRFGLGRPAWIGRYVQKIKTSTTAAVEG